MSLVASVHSFLNREKKNRCRMDIKKIYGEKKQLIKKSRQIGKSIGSDWFFDVKHWGMEPSNHQA
jgi:hypothetical protein